MKYQRIEDMRIDSDLTQEEVARILGCNRNVYSRYERGVYDIPVWALIRLSLHYKVSTDYLLGLTNRPERG